jgi:hypothetical protein
MSSNLSVTSLVSGVTLILSSSSNPNSAPGSFSTGTLENLEVMVFVNLLVHQIYLLSSQL